MSKNLTKLSNASASDFFEKLAYYKQAIDADIEQYCRTLEVVTAEQFGDYSLETIKAFTSVLRRGGKRIRGALTMHAYKSFGGTDETVALQAARTIEMLQAYVLITDDIMDRSPTRRGGPTAHMMLKKYHKDHHLSGDAQHFGESIAMNAALFGSHAAMLQIGKLPVSSEQRIAALNIVNSMLMATAHGQINDVFNEVIAEASEQSVENVLVWKTAYYTFTNPLQFGAALTGVEDERLEALADFSLHAGRAFQIIDDILGTFGNEFESGKSPLDDIKEGKRTLLIVKTMQAAPKSDAYFLRQCLGDQQLSLADFHRCQEIIRESGVLDAVRAEANKSTTSAVAVLQDRSLPSELVQFLTDLVQYIVVRKS